MDIFVIQTVLGIILFFLINWIGKHSYSIGYIEITLFVRTEEAPALNFLIRVLTPIVYLIVVSTILYNFALDRYVTNIYLVNIYYIAFRLIFNLVTNRGLLLNWYRQSLYWMSIAIISYFVYEKIIKVKSNILPDFSTVANELWIIILIFLFQVINNIRLSQNGTIRRKDNYLVSRYSHFKRLYGNRISEITQNELLESITYSILIYEDFNRPKIVRLVENFVIYFSKKPLTLGVMQFNSSKKLSDKESVVLGTNKIVSDFKKIEGEAKAKDAFYIYNIIEEVIQSYNGGMKYKSEVIELRYILEEKYYKNCLDQYFEDEKNQ